MNSSGPRNILIIDDEEPILRMLSMVLSQRGFKADTAGNGAEGIQKIQSNEYDLVLTDMLMPDISGEQVLQELRKIKGHSIPIIGMSGTPWLLDNHLFDAVLEKPYSIKQLLELIHNILSSEAKT